MTKKTLVSACLAGKACRYDGKANLHPKIKKMVEEGEAITVCPEQLGGLSTPRIPCEIINDRQGLRVINKSGQDMTKAFIKGARKTVEIAKENHVTEAILKSNSPSCGCGQIYDGTFSGVLIKGEGITTIELKKNGITVKTEKTLKRNK